MRIFVTTLLLLCTLALSRADAQQIAFTFDDGLDVHKEPEAPRWNRAMLSALAKAGVRALLLPAGKHACDDAGLALVRAWGEAGHAVGNHTWSHRNLEAASMSAKAFTADIARAEAVLSDVPGWTPLFRFPYLKEGADVRERDAVRAWLADHGYRHAPVSIDTSDWYYAMRYRAWQAANPQTDPSAYRQAYLDHLWDRAQYYDGLSQRHLGRSVPHVLLLHTNAINAAFLGDAIAMFRARGWTIVDPETALRDPVYAPVDALPAGESPLWVLARRNGEAGLRYPPEDGPYERATLDALEARLAGRAH